MNFSAGRRADVGVEKCLLDVKDQGLWPTKKFPEHQMPPPIFVP